MEAIKPHLDVARAEAIRWLGDWHPLVRQIAPGEGVTRPQGGQSLQSATAIVSPACLQSFLLNYKSTVLLPNELPLVRQACEHTLRNEVNELLKLDRNLASANWFSEFKEDSRVAGRLHLERLKPLRDQRGVRRYLAAIEQNQANGWHLLVAGVALGLYSVPLRQGMMDYALHTFWNVIGQAAQPMGLSSSEVTQMVNDLSADLPGRIQEMFPPVRLSAV